MTTPEQAAITKPEKSEIAQRFGLPEPPQITDLDTSAINSGPAFYSNKMYATMLPQGMRLTFAEINPASPAPAFRTAIFLSFQDAAALADLLQRQLGQLDFVPFTQPAGDSGETT